MSEAFAQHAEHIKQHAAKVLNHVADAAKVAGVSCETVQIEHDQPYQAVITTAKDKGCDVIVMASHGRSGISAVLLGSVASSRQWRGEPVRSTLINVFETRKQE